MTLEQLDVDAVLHALARRAGLRSADATIVADVDLGDGLTHARVFQYRHAPGKREEAERLVCILRELCVPSADPEVEAILRPLSPEGRKAAIAELEAFVAGLRERDGLASLLAASEPLGLVPDRITFPAVPPEWLRNLIASGV